MAIKDAQESHQRLKRDLDKLLNKHAGQLPAEEILAVMSQIVGMAVAMQDQLTMRPARAMKIVAMNIEIGNRLVVDDLMNSKGSA